MIWILFLIICALFLGREYLGIRKQLQFWKDNGVPYISPIWTMFRHPVHPLNTRMYEEFKGKGPFGAFYRTTTPTIFLTDLDLVKDILVKNFDHFENRISYGQLNYGFSFGGVFFAKEQEWRMQRRKTDPMYTSKNLKMLHKTLSDATQNFLRHMEKSVENDKEIDGNALMQDYLIESCGAVFFGSTFNAVKDEEYVRKLRSNTKSIIRGTIQFVRFAVWLPKLCEFLKMAITTAKIRKIFLNYLHKTVEVRVKNNEDVDIVGLCLRTQNEEKSGKLLLQELANQLYFFYFTELNVVRRILIFIFYELALSPEIQNRAREEINKITKEYNDECTYDACMEMKYVNQIILETIRKYPTTQNLLRICTKTYKVPGTSYTIEKGTPVVISGHTIHNDPEIYPEPNKFDPDRFTKDAISARHSQAWLGFGAGPRMCVGMRISMIQLEIAVANFISNYHISMTSKMAATLPTDSFGLFEYLTNKDGKLGLTFKKI